MARQRLRKSRLARQALRPTGSSDGRTETRLDATRVTAGHKSPREQRVSAIDPERAAQIMSQFPDATLRAVKLAEGYYRSDMLTWIDESRKGA